MWWLVSPQNPLKPQRGMAPQADRLARAAALISDPRIKLTDIETRLGTRYTADTVIALRRRFPNTRFVWLMGADNLAQLRRWDRWQTIFRTVPIAVFARPSYCLRALSDMAARRYARWRVPARASRRLVDLNPPAWVFVAARLDARSATEIRSNRGRARVPRGGQEGKR